MSDENEVKMSINKEKYQASKTAGGKKSMNNGDIVATTLEGMTNEEIYEICDTFLVFPEGKELDLRKKYATTSKGTAMNDGMQRMNLGSRIRGQIAKIDKENIADAAIRAEKEQSEKTYKSGEEKFTKVAAPTVKLVKARIATAEKEKAAAEKEKADDKAAKIKAKEDAKAEREKAAAAKKAEKAAAAKKAA